MLALVQIVFDYYRVENDNSFWATVNIGKLAMNFVSVIATVFLFVQHHCIYGPIEPVIIGSKKQIQTKILKKTSADYTFPPTDVTEITETYGLNSQK